MFRISSPQKVKRERIQVLNPAQCFRHCAGFFIVIIGGLEYWWADFGWSGAEAKIRPTGRVGFVCGVGI